MKIAPMTPDDFADYEQWQYEPPYDFYDSDQEPVLNPERFFGVRDDDGRADRVPLLRAEGRRARVRARAAARPDGKGLGLEFFRAGLEFGRERYRPSLIRLFVAAFNERAIKVYERAGFRETGRHVRTFARWGDVEFVNMDEQR